MSDPIVKSQNLHVYVLFKCHFSQERERERESLLCPFFRFSVSFNKDKFNYKHTYTVPSSPHHLLILFPNLCFVDMAIQAQLYTDNLGFSLGGSQDLMENACGGVNHFCLTTHQQPNLQQQQQQMFTQKIINQNLMNNNITESMPFSQFLATQMEKQRIEFDQFITLQVCYSYFWV